MAKEIFHRIVIGSVFGKCTRAPVKLNKTGEFMQITDYSTKTEETSTLSQVKNCLQGLIFGPKCEDLKKKACKKCPKIKKDPCMQKDTFLKIKKEVCHLIKKDTLAQPMNIIRCQLPTKSECPRPCPKKAACPEPCPKKPASPDPCAKKVECPPDPCAKKTKCPPDPCAKKIESPPDPCAKKTECPPDPCAKKTECSADPCAKKTECPPDPCAKKAEEQSKGGQLKCPPRLRPPQPPHCPEKLPVLAKCLGPCPRPQGDFKCDKN